MEGVDCPVDGEKVNGARRHARLQSEGGQYAAELPL